MQKISLIGNVYNFIYDYYPDGKLCVVQLHRIIDDYNTMHELNIIIKTDVELKLNKIREYIRQEEVRNALTSNAKVVRI